MDAIMEVILYEASILLEIVVKALIGMFGTWVLAQIGKSQKLKHVEAAAKELLDAAQETAAALQQTTVEQLKAAHEDGKLTEDEIKTLNTLLLKTTMQKLSDPAVELLKAAGKDISAMILDAADAWILANKGK